MDFTLTGLALYPLNHLTGYAFITHIHVCAHEREKVRRRGRGKEREKE